MRIIISTLSPLRGPDWFRDAHLPPSRKAEYKQVCSLLLLRASVLPINRERAPSGNFSHAVRSSRKAEALSTLLSQLTSLLQVQSYNTLHPACHLLSFSISKSPKNRRLTNRHSTPYKHWKIFQNLTATEQASHHWPSGMPFGNSTESLPVYWNLIVSHLLSRRHNMTSLRTPYVPHGLLTPTCVKKNGVALRYALQAV